MPIVESPVIAYTGQAFYLRTAHTAYVIGLTEHGGLLHRYFGPVLSRAEDYPTPNWGIVDASGEYPTPTGMWQVAPCIRVVFHDNVRDLRLRYQGHEISASGDELAIRLHDEHYGLEVTLCYHVYADCDVIARQVRLRNTGADAIDVEEVMSASFSLPYDRGGEFRLNHFAGAWMKEKTLGRQVVTPGQKVLQSWTNSTSHQQNPFFAIDVIDAEGNGATEEHGEIWFGQVHWSGNWKIVVEQLRGHHKITRVAAGLNDLDCILHLAPGEDFTTPLVTLGYTDGGFGAMSRLLHRYQRAHILPRNHADELRPVLYNSWEAVMFDVSEDAQARMAEKAAQLGVELFVIDDGWFGARNTDNAGLGDWYPNPEKFPNGLNPLIDRVNALGMDFGIWVEPEMVNPDSDLYRAHPDWVYHFPTRESTLLRTQLMLNFAREDVREYIFNSLDTLLSEHNIRYIKWDFNRTISEPGWPEAPRERQREMWVRHYEGLYGILDRLRARHPQVLFESCAGGGGRVDLGAFTHYDDCWTSDNSDPYDRLFIQRSFMLAYTAKVMRCWVTETSMHEGASYSLAFRFHSAFMGSLGLGGNLLHFSEEEMAEMARNVALYKELRPLIQHGEMYRLIPLSRMDRIAVEYVDPQGSEALVLAFGTQENFWENPVRLCLRGLDPQALYRLEGDLDEGQPESMSGQALMHRGILPRLYGHIASALIRVRKA